MRCSSGAWAEGLWGFVGMLPLAHAWSIMTKEVGSGRMNMEAKNPTSQARRYSWSKDKDRTKFHLCKMTLFYVISSMRWVSESLAGNIIFLPWYYFNSSLWALVILYHHIYLVGLLHCASFQCRGLVELSPYISTSKWPAHCKHISMCTGLVSCLIQTETRERMLQDVYK